MIRRLALLIAMMSVATACDPSERSLDERRPWDGTSHGEASEAGEAGEAPKDDDVVSGVDEVCRTWTATSGMQTPDIMVVLDKSGSMAERSWDHDADAATPEVSRWSSVHAVVSSWVEAHTDVARVGAVLFPSLDATSGPDEQQACRMDEAPAVPLSGGTAAGFVSALPGAQAEVQGGAPARFAVLDGLEHLARRDDARGPRALVLVTGGDVDCVPGAEPFDGTWDAGLREAVRAGWEFAGVPTYVVGVDVPEGIDERTGVDAAQALDEVAQIGGRADLAQGFSASRSEDDLAAALERVSRDVACTVALEDASADEILELRIDGAAVPTEQWSSGDAGQSSVRLHGPACDAYLAGAPFEADLSCPTAL